jgi:hypothetical protein
MSNGGKRNKSAGALSFALFAKDRAPRISMHTVAYLTLELKGFVGANYRAQQNTVAEKTPSPALALCRVEVRMFWKT